MWYVWKSGKYFTESGDWTDNISLAYKFITKDYAKHIATSYKATVIVA